LSSSAHTAGLKKNPWMRSQRRAPRNASCVPVSTPSATTSSLRAWAITITAVTIALSPRTVPMLRTKDWSIFRVSMGS
jgi:hypothetical protein